MIKPVIHKEMSFAEIEHNLVISCHAYVKEYENPLSLTTKYAALFKWHLTCGILDYMRSLNELEAKHFTTDFRYAQLEQSLSKLSQQRIKEKDLE